MRQARWYAVKDSESYSSVRWKAVLHPAHGEQEMWIAHNLSHENAQSIADDHNHVAAISSVASEKRARLTNDEVMAWVGRHDLSMNVYEARRVIEDARSIRLGDPITNGVPTSEDPPSLR